MISLAAVRTTAGAQRIDAALTPPPGGYRRAPIETAQRPTPPNAIAAAPAAPLGSSASRTGTRASTPPPSSPAAARAAGCGSSASRARTRATILTRRRPAPASTGAWQLGRKCGPQPTFACASTLITSGPVVLYRRAATQTAQWSTKPHASAAPPAAPLGSSASRTGTHATSTPVVLYRRAPTSSAIEGSRA